MNIQDITNIYVGNAPADAIYIGTAKVWPKGLYNIYTTGTQFINNAFDAYASFDNSRIAEVLADGSGYWFMKCNDPSITIDNYTTITPATNTSSFVCGVFFYNGPLTTGTITGFAFSNTYFDCTITSQKTLHSVEFIMDSQPVSAWQNIILSAGNIELNANSVTWFPPTGTNVTSFSVSSNGQQTLDVYDNRIIAFNITYKI